MNTNGFFKWTLKGLRKEGGTRPKTRCPGNHSKHTTALCIEEWDSAHTLQLQALAREEQDSSKTGFESCRLTSSCQIASKSDLNKRHHLCCMAYSSDSNPFPPAFQHGYLQGVIGQYKMWVQLLILHYARCMHFHFSLYCLKIFVMTLCQRENYKKSGRSALILTTMHL